MHAGTQCLAFEWVTTGQRFYTVLDIYYAFILYVCYTNLLNKFPVYVIIIRKSSNVRDILTCMHCNPMYTYIDILALMFATRSF